MSLIILNFVILGCLMGILWRVFWGQGPVLSEADKAEVISGITRIVTEHTQVIRDTVKDEVASNKLFIVEKNNENFGRVIKDLGEFKTTINETLYRFRQDLSQSLQDHSDKQNKEFVHLKEKIEQNLIDFEKLSSEKMDKSLKTTTDQISEKMKELTLMVETKLTDISGKVEEKLTKGFEKNNETFIQITQRLTKIDEAQKKIESLSQDVGSLQNILTDKKTRGIFGEVQLNQILIAIFGENNPKLYRLQQSIGTAGAIVDAMLYLPEPLGSVPVDSKFPMENYERMIDPGLDEYSREAARKEFKLNIRKHIQDIASKYIIQGISEQAILFLPAEAVFAEIHAYHMDLVEAARSKNVWIVSPSTFMALLTTIQSVLRNIETQHQAKIIQEQLGMLAKEFGRYKTRWVSLARHIDQVSDDVKEITITTDKISAKFEKIERVELEDEPAEMLEMSGARLIEAPQRE